MRLTILIAFILLVCVVCILSGSSSAQATSTDPKAKSGSICILPNSPEPPTRISPGGMYNPNTLTLRVDQHKPLRWLHNDPVLIDQLDLQDNHLLVLTSDGKRIQSFRFKFSDGDGARLCIYYDGYQGVQLGNTKNADWCRVKARACWR